jgi:ketosteroid isomerase-like protein
MSQENIEIVRRIYDALNRGDWDTAFRDAHPEFEFTSPPQAPDPGTHRGRDAVEAALQDQLAAYEAWNAEPERFYERGDQVVAFIKVRVRPKGSNAELEIRNGALWTIRDGVALSLRMFPEPEKALEAAGLRE